MSADFQDFNCKELIESINNSSIKFVTDLVMFFRRNLENYLSEFICENLRPIFNEV